ncbi:aldo/keto reductase [Tranquillimonas alkanivorans]|uniref:Predicted oxidoreductase n=1 Tax=Tranquillimonas alkanivorans TaxID=441119 RepID=A0A1I5MD87_9RHOB|nr:aldo/keto reductase [Tranquillimonas alkanivorans]SFP07479.1 Predicted oxidoreductase [Tranquillimonas alkanivorans]
MKRMTLGRTGIEVSEFCLGSMTWGSQNTEAEGHAQIDHALDAGVDFIDTAEMYPTNPVKAETVGDTETIIGNWIEKTGRRNDVVLATKISGKNGGFVRDGRGIDPETVTEAVEASLKRLKTDVIDLYQFHWPNRGSYHFRQIWGYDPSGQDTAEILDTMAGVTEVLKDLVQQGKIRTFGLSNDTAWGTMQWLRAAEAADGPRVATMQNEYSLLCRQYDSDFAELAVHEDVTLLAYSPLAAGLLSGKYQNGQVPEGSRMSLTPDLGGRKSERVFPAIDAYHAVAAKHGLNPVQMALAWTRTRPFPTIPIFGATSMEQLETALGAADLTLDQEVLDDIEATHKAHPMPY